VNQELTSYAAAVPSLASRARTGRSTTRPPVSADPSFAEYVCLTLIIQGASHGWAVGSLLAPAAPLGRIWTLTRPLTYRAIDGLVDKGLVTRRGAASGRGRDRMVLAATPAGRRAAKRWLDAPVAHLREVRTDLLLKLALRERAGLDNAALLAAQQAVFEPTIDGLTSAGRDDDLIDLWRRESARAVRRFLDEALHPVELQLPAKSHHDPTGGTMQLSARNQLNAVVDTVTHGEVMSTVKVTLPDGQHITAAITKDAAEELSFAPGDAVIVVIKSTEVMLAKN
jgi:molybdopterin-binding protein